MGSNETTKEVIEGSFLKFLTCLDNILQSYPFLLGAAQDRAILLFWSINAVSSV